jgi:hypothetical protein
MPSPAAVKSYLAAHPDIHVIHYDSFAESERGKDYLNEVADQVRTFAEDDGDDEPPDSLYILSHNVIDKQWDLVMRIAPLLLSTTVLTRLQNFEQAFHRHMVRLQDIPDDGDLGVLYVRDANQRVYGSDNKASERGHWRIERITKVGRTNVTTDRGVYDIQTGATKDGYGHKRAVFSRRAMEDSIFDSEERWKIVRAVERLPISKLRKVAEIVESG